MRCERWGEKSGQAVGPACRGAPAPLTTRAPLTPPPPTAAPQGKKALLLVGNHKVKGVVEELDAPLVLLEQREGGAGGGDGAGSGAGDDEAMLASGDEQERPAALRNVAYVVKAKIKRKIIFTERPQPIIRAAERV